MNNSIARPDYRTAKAVVSLFLSVLLITSGCTTTRSFTSAEAVKEEIRRGDQVTVVLKDGRELELTVSVYTGDRLEGLDRAGVLHSVASANIAQVDITRKAPVKTALLVLAISGVVLSAMAAGVYGDFLSGPVIL